MAETPTGTATTDEVRRGPQGGGRGNPAARASRYTREVAAEMRKVIWPTRGELVTYTSVVLVFVSIMIGIVFLLDFAFGEAMIAIFG